MIKQGRITEGKRKMKGGIYFGQCRYGLSVAGSIHIGGAIFFSFSSKKEAEKANSLCSFMYHDKHPYMECRGIVVYDF
jgi:hypothetical protein